jgi:GNAT superfamily N-acetyltransferase
VNGPVATGGPCAAVPKLRNYRPEDLDALYAISLATGNSGGDAAHLYDDPHLMGHIYAAPYAELEPGLVHVVEDGNGVGGYVLGALDTLEWTGRLEREWWPRLRGKYDNPADFPEERRTPDQRRAAMIHKPETPPAEVVERFPAHMHMNLLPRLQGRGLGTALLEIWLGIARHSGVTRVHVGANRGNTGALRFWQSRGFREIGPQRDGRTVWMGLDAAKGADG